MRKDIITGILTCEAITIIAQWFIFREFAGEMWLGFNFAFLLYWFVNKFTPLED